MTFRLEVGKSRSYSWGFFLEQARRVPTYRCFKASDGKFEIHALTFDGIGDLIPFFKITMGWSQAMVYHDEKPIIYDEVWRLYRHSIGQDEFGCFPDMCHKCGAAMDPFKCQACGFKTETIETEAVRETRLIEMKGAHGPKR